MSQTGSFHVVLPSVVPQFVGLLLYRFDVNVRASLVLGLVGAGGIGFLINQSISLFRFDEMLTYIIMVLVSSWPSTCSAPASGTGSRVEPSRGQEGRDLRLLVRRVGSSDDGSTKGHPMLRARIELAIACVATVLTVAAVLWPTWIESLSGLEPDGGSGGAEWWLAIVFAAVAAGSALLARRDCRRAAAGESG